MTRPSRPFLLLASMSLALTACGAVPAPKAFARPIPSYSAGAHFVVVGDVQRTSLLEFWREWNDAERHSIVNEIARDRPAFLALTGDLVFAGGSERQWADFDALTAPLHDADIPAVSALGNHEYWNGRAGAKKFFARFPLLEGRHHHAHAWGDVTLVFLDSNRSELSELEWRDQRRWYEETLAALDHDPTVRGVLVLMHHAPFTNSTVTSDDAGVQQDFVPAFLGATKTLAMICGHVHSYERFARGGKAFVVNGGGGGPRADLSTGDDRRHPDDLFFGPARRDFEFLRIAPEASGLSVEVRGLAKGETVFRRMDEFFLPFAKRD